MLRPVADLATIQDRQDTVQLLMDARDVAAALQGILKKVREAKERVCGGGKVLQVQVQEEGTASTGAGAGAGGCIAGEDGLAHAQAQSRRCK